MSYKLSQKEYDALQIAGFSSVEELLARYFELVKNAKMIDIAFKSYERSLADAVGSAKCQVNVSNQRGVLQND